MSFNQIEYISKYNKENYKMYQFRVKKGSKLMTKLDNMKNRQQYILSMLEESDKEILTIKQIKTIIKPIFRKYGINEIFLFGSYARGEATSLSDVDILCEDGNVRTFIEQGKLQDELEIALNKKVDLIFLSSEMNEYFYDQIKEDMIKLC